MGMDAKTAILEQKTALGIELGSTRIKAVLIGADNAPIASGDHEWEKSEASGLGDKLDRQLLGSQVGGPSA